MPKNKYNIYWNPEGWMDYSEEWYFSGKYTASLKPNDEIFNNSFPYNLSLIKMKSGYILEIYLHFNYEQEFTIATKVRVYSKEKACKKALEIIQDFEKDKEKVKEIWKKIRHKIPIINSEGTWIASVIINSPEQNLSKSNDFYGDFYSIQKSKYKINEKDKYWYWRLIKVHGCGYSSTGCKEVPIIIWLSIIGYDKYLDSILKKVISVKEKAKINFLINKMSADKIALKILNNFYNGNENTFRMLEKNDSKNIQ